MSTAVGHIDTDPKALRLRTARQQHEARVRFWRVFAVSSFFVVVLGANLYIGAVVVMGNFGSHFGWKSAADGRTAQVRRPLLDGKFCRNIVFDNKTALAVTDKVERCDGAANTPSPPTGNRRTQFSWGGR